MSFNTCQKYDLTSFESNETVHVKHTVKILNSQAILKMTPLQYSTLASSHLKNWNSNSNCYHGNVASRVPLKPVFPNSFL